MRCHRLTLGLLLVGLTWSGCGSSSPSTVTITTPAAPAAPAPSLAAYVSEDAVVDGPYIKAPTTLGFSADGDLQAVNLVWSDWGSPVTYAHGTFLFREYPSDARVALPGTVTLSVPVTCGGKAYYSTAAVRAPGGPFAPSPLTPFRTPCGGTSE